MASDIRRQLDHPRDVFTVHEYLACLCEMGQADAMLLKIEVNRMMILH
jgi:hypothetical protein